MGAAWSDSGLVFTQADGSAWHPDTVSSRFEMLSRRVKLPRISIKNLRHSSATLGLESGETLKELSERLGHSTITITADTYAAVTPATAQESAKRRAAAVPRKVRAHQREHQGTSEAPERLPGQRKPRSAGVDLTHQNKNRLIFVQGPEITVRPVSARLLTRGDAE